MATCPFCQEEMQAARRGLTEDVNCPRCGSYSVTSTAVALVQRKDSFTKRQAANISGWLRENQGFVIGSNNLDFLRDLPTPSFQERADKLLLQLEDLTEFAGQVFARTPSWLSMAWAVSEEEIREIVGYLTSLRYLVSPSNSPTTNLKIAPEGWAHLESLKKGHLDRKQGFVAMWFSDEMREVYENAIAPGIRNAGYLPHRVDLGEHNKKIDDQIIAEIRRSRFVLADFTGHRGGVYYEAGFANGLGLEVIWTCREDDVKNLHFDIRQYNCIPWSRDNLSEFSRRITNRIEAVLGEGPFKEKA